MFRRDRSIRAAGRPAARSLAAAVAALALCVIVATPASALETEQFGVEPYPLFVSGDVRRSFEVTLDPGAALTDAVRVWNKTQEPVVVRLYGAGVEVTDGQYQIAAYEARDRGAGDWLRPEVGDIRLGPDEERIVRFTVSAPPILPEEGQTVALVAESDTGLETQGVDVVARLAMLVEIDPESSGLAGISWWVWLAAALILAVAVSQLVARRARRRRVATA